MLRLVLLLIVSLSGLSCFAETPPFYKSSQLLSVQLKTYAISSKEGIVLYGAMRRHCIDEHWYWGEFGYGAVAGIRGGYLEGGLVAGRLFSITPALTLDTRMMVGAGGGASAPQGGGMIVNPSLGVQYPINHTWSFQTDIGYIRFLNGDIQSLTFNCGLHCRFWKLEVQ